MLILNATDTLSATAGASTALSVTVYGLEVTASAQTFKRLYQGQPANTATTLYTAPAATQTLVKTITVANPTGGAQTIAFFQAGTAATNAIVPPMSIDAGGMAVYDGDGWTFTTIAGATKQALSAVWSAITGTPTTLSGYGITDAYTKTVSDGRYDVLGAAAAVTPTTLGLVIGTNTQAHGAKLDSIQALASAAGWLHNDGAGAFAYSTPTYTQVGADAAGAAAAVTPTSLGLVIGTNVQAYNANLTAINQGLTTTSNVTFGTVTTGALTATTGTFSGAVLINAVGADAIIVNAVAGVSSRGNIIVTGTNAASAQIACYFGFNIFDTSDTIQIGTGVGPFIKIASLGAVTLSSTLAIRSLGAFVASDKYLIVDSSGNVHKSALGPLS